MRDLGLTACGVTVAALRGHSDSVDILLGDLPADELFIVARAALVALGAAVRAVPGGEDSAAHIALGLQQETFRNIIQGDTP